MKPVLLHERNGVFGRETGSEAIDCRLTNFLGEISEERVKNELLGSW
jgi:hypothetical protein